MKSMLTMVVAALCCAAVAEGPGDGRGRRGGMGPHEGGMGPMALDPIVRVVTNPKAAESLGLTDEQVAKVAELQKSAKANRETQQKVRAATLRQIELMKADTVDEAAVMKSIDEVFDLRKEMAKEQARRVIAVKSVLTPEQIAKAHEALQKFRAEHPERGPHRKGPPRGAASDGDKPAPKPEAE